MLKNQKMVRQAKWRKPRETKFRIIALVGRPRLPKSMTPSRKESGTGLTILRRKDRQREARMTHARYLFLYSKMKAINRLIFHFKRMSSP